MILLPELTDEAEPLRAFGRLRGRQAEWLEAIDTDLRTFSRVLVVGPGGIGKTTLFGALAERWNMRGLKSLVLETRDRLVGQTAQRIRDETGIEVDIEMGDSFASPSAPIVVASVQTLGRINRLTAFSDSHFGLLVPDEAHLSMAPQFQRVMSYFHYGAASLNEDWIPPADGTYEPLCRIAAFTATPDIGERRSLMQFYQHRSVSYSYLEAVRDGWLVRPIQKSIPVRVDLRKYKAASTPNGMDFRTSDLAVAMAPVIEELADQIVAHASDRKTIAFLPSVECARMMTDAVARRGLKAMFVSGECLDADEKTDEFVRSGPGTVLSNAVIYSFGVDFPDVDCIAWFRATLSKAFYIQGIYRGTRVLPGVIDGLATAEERVAAIAASAKSSLLILDPLFVHDRIDLCDSYDLFTDKPEVKEKMKALGPPTPENAEKAQRDFLKSLDKAARKEARKSARVVDPLIWALQIGQEKLASYTPQAVWESNPPTQGQLDFLKKQHIDVTPITSKGLAQRVITTLLARMKLHLATPVQLNFLKSLGIPDEKISALSQREASNLIDATLSAKRA